MRQASDELRQALSRIGESIYGEPVGAGVGGDGTKGASVKGAEQAPEEAVEGEFHEI